MDIDMDTFDFENWNAVERYIINSWPRSQKYNLNTMTDFLRCVYNTGMDTGEIDGYKLALKENGINNEDVDDKYQEGYADGYEDGETYGSEEGVSLAYDTGKGDGYSDGYEEGRKDGWNEGYEEGEKTGRDAGYDDGYGKGYEDGKGE